MADKESDLICMSSDVISNHGEFRQELRSGEVDAKINSLSLQLLSIQDDDITATEAYGMATRYDGVGRSSQQECALPPRIYSNTEVFPDVGRQANIAPTQSKGLASDGHVCDAGNVAQAEDLKRVVQQQLEYYFSKENLASDKYLLSQMDGDNFVPVTVVANFNQVKKLTSDMQLILDAVRSSGLLQLDERDEKVRAVPEKRCVLILREVPNGASEEAIRQLVNNEKCPNMLSCEFVENNCWYLSFSSEEETQKAFQYLREDVKEFMGQPIRARIKGTMVQRPSGVPKKQSYNTQYPPIQPVPPLGPPMYYPLHHWPGAPYVDHSHFLQVQLGPFPPPPPHAFGGPPRFGQGGGRGRGPGGRMQNRYLPVAEGTAAINGGRGMRSNRDEDVYSNRQRNLPARMRKQRPEEQYRPPRQIKQMQQENFNLETDSNSFPPLSDAPSNPATISLNLAEEGASNLADIVKGKHLKEGAAALNGSSSVQLNGLSERLSTSKVVSVPIKVQSSSNQQSSSSTASQLRSQHKPQHKPEPKDMKPQVHLYSGKVSPSSSPDEKPSFTAVGNSVNVNATQPSQVPRSDSSGTHTPATAIVKSKHKEKKTSPSTRNVSKHSPKPSKKHSATSSDKMQCQKNPQDVNTKPSYAEMIQKPKAPKPFNGNGDASPPLSSPVLQSQTAAVPSSSGISPSIESNNSLFPPVSVASD